MTTHPALVVFAFCFMLMCAGASFTAGVALVCRLLKWAPVNVTVNLRDYRDHETYGVKGEIENAR